MDKNQKSQKTLVLEHLLSGQSITELEAIVQYGIGHLAGRIKELKDDGNPIIADTIEVVKAFGGTARVSRYYLPNNLKNK